MKKPANIRSNSNFLTRAKTLLTTAVTTLAHTKSPSQNIYEVCLANRQKVVANSFSSLLSDGLLFLNLRS